MERVVLFGPPGVGKGTQGGRLAAALGVPAISTGDLFRAHVRGGTELGNRLSALIASGDYVPDSVTNSMLAERLAQPDAADGFLPMEMNSKVARPSGPAKDQVISQTPGAP